MIVLTFRIRYCASNWWCPQYQVGSQRDHHDWGLLHSTRHHPTDWSSWSRPDHPRTSRLYNNVLRSETYCCAFHQILTVHTFVAALWQVGLQERGIALGMVCLVCVFITLCVAIGAGIHNDYIVPTVRLLNPVFFHLFLTADTTRVSIGAGSIVSTWACVLVVYSSGCGSHYLLRQYYTSLYISGLKVACLSMNGAGSGFTLRTPI
jgi:hypothetical protein